ncbi:MAG: hypothetical protein M4579_000204 [Chaenotheca gracillima]|nr:MAG: hypothetical protein M4579_000204 [Chaenotheca gracillima]
MEGPGRGFEEVRVDATGVQLAKDRFPSNVRAQPEIATWRCNLTGLSQFHNLYFVVYSTKLYVYQPQFPKQALLDRPDLIIDLPVSKPGLTGYINLRSPHDVNNMVVDELGDEEIVVCACDDGDVIAFYTRSIMSAVERRAEIGILPEVDAEAAKPFFLENVGKSSWGLTVHKAHRMIAVSSNTTDITVFVFGLAEREASSDSESSDDHTNSQASKGMAEHPGLQSSFPQHLFSRANNVRVLLTDHEHNIPSISFYNGQTPPEETWLVSTDIGGWIMLWNIETQRLVKKVRTEDGFLGNRLRDPCRGWSVLCLDLDNFRTTNGSLETFGCQNPSKASSRLASGFHAIWDITASVSQVQDSSTLHPSIDHTIAIAEDQVDLFDETDDEEEEDDDEMLDDMEDHDEEMLEADNQGLNEGEALELYLQHDLGLHVGHAAGDAEFFTDEPGPFETVPQNEAFELLLEQLHQSGVVLDRDFQVDDVGALHDLITYAQGARFPRPAHSAVDNGSSTFKLATEPLTTRKASTPHFAILHTTEKNVQLFSDPLSGSSTICRSPMAQQMVPHQGFLRQYKRLNMTQQIPELGLVVVASQTGRVAILRLTQSGGKRAQYAFRVEWLLPFLSQEKRSNRPETPLLGIAVAPIQGMEKASDPDDLEGSSSKSNRRQTWRRFEPQRRYRLMITYFDGTVLSYEIGRSTAAVVVGQSRGRLAL